MTGRRNIKERPFHPRCVSNLISSSFPDKVQIPVVGTPNPSGNGCNQPLHAISLLFQFSLLRGHLGISQTLPPKHSTCLQASVPLSMLSSQPGPRHPLLGLGSPRSTSSASGKPSISSKLGWCPPVNSPRPPPGQHLSHCDHPLPHLFLYSPGDSAGAALSQVSNRHATPGRRPITY